MATREENAPYGTPAWIDLKTPDLEHAKRFYGAVFGWDFRDYGPAAGHYHTCQLRDEPVAGIMRAREGAPAQYWQTFFASDDCDETVKHVAGAGGDVIKVHDVLDLARLAKLKDPTGAQFGIWEGRAHCGSRIVGETSSWAWSEMATSDPEGAAEFYRSIFEYSLRPVEGEPGHTMLSRPDGEAVACVRSVPAAEAVGWTVCFEVEDINAAVRRVRDAGGSVLDEPAGTHYGRAAKVADPFGAHFKLVVAPPGR